MNYRATSIAGLSGCLASSIRSLTLLTFSLALIACDKGDDSAAGSGAGGDDKPAPAPPADTPQVIKLERPHTVGAKFHLEANGDAKQDMQMSMNGQSVPQQSKSEQFSAVIDADVEVLGVSEAGKITKAAIQVKSLTRTDAGAEASSLLENAAVEAEAGPDGTTYLVGGAPLDEKIQETLKLFSLISKEGSSRASEDLLFGTTEPRKPGDEWPVDGAAVAASFAEDTGMQLDPETVKGTMKFEKVSDVNGVPCQFIAGTVTMDLSSFPGLPPEAKVTDSTVEVKISGAFPVDTSLPAVEQATSMAMAPTVTFLAPGASGEIKMDMKQSTTTKRTMK